MKRILVFVLVFISVFVLSSCGNDKNNLSETTTIETELNSTLNKLRANAFDSKTNQTVIWKEYQFELPNNWDYQYSKNKSGIYIYPDKETPPVFSFGTMSTEEEYDLSNEEEQYTLSLKIVNAFSEQIGECSLINYKVPTKYAELSDDSKLDITGRRTLHINCSAIINNKICTGYIVTFYMEDILYSFSLFEYNDSQYTFCNDLDCIAKSIKLVDKKTETVSESTAKETTIEEKATETTGEVECYVYITNTGSKYHTSTCRWVSKSCIRILYEEAINKGYTPCGTCNPTP